MRRNARTAVARTLAHQAATARHDRAMILGPATSALAILNSALHVHAAPVLPPMPVAQQTRCAQRHAQVRPSPLPNASAAPQPRARGRAGCAPCVPGAMPPKAAAAAAAAAAAGAEAADSGAGAGGPVYKKARNANPGVRVVGACCRCCVGAARGCGVAGAAALESCFDSSAFGGKADARRCGALATRRRAHLRLGQRQDVPPGASRGRGARSGAQADAAASRSAVPPEDDRAEGALRRRRPRRGGDQGARVRRVLVREVPVQPVRNPQALTPGPFVLRTAC